MKILVLALLMVLSPFAAAHADDDEGESRGKLPTMQQLADDAGDRFPQPVRVGDLIGRAVQEPVVSHDYLGRVRALVRDKDGLKVVIDYGGWFGFGTRRIAVSANAVTLLGRTVEIVAYRPEQLKAFPTFNPASVKPVGADEIVKIGLSKPSH